MRRFLRGLLLGLLAVFLIAWGLTLPRATSGRPILTGAQVGPVVLAILQRSCADCHSDTTRYPWYSYVAPSSFLVAWDISGGRRHMNLSHWDEYPVVRRMRLLSEMANQVKDGEMPLWQYTLIHRDAKLLPADVDAIFQWTQSERARLIGARGD